VSPAPGRDPTSPLHWTCKSTAELAAELTAQGHRVSDRTVAALLRQQSYRLYCSRKMLEGTQHTERDRQFLHLAAQAAAFQRDRQPVISLSTRKKEVVWDRKDRRLGCQTAESPQDVPTHESFDMGLGKAPSYAMNDLIASVEWVTPAMDHRTAVPVNAIRTWWELLGRALYPAAQRLLIAVDRVGDRGGRRCRWQLELQPLSVATGLEIAVSEIPRGTSKWNGIEHQMFFHITQNQGSGSLTRYEVVINLIGAAMTATGSNLQGQVHSPKESNIFEMSDVDLISERCERDSHDDAFN